MNQEVFGLSEKNDLGIVIPDNIRAWFNVSGSVKTILDDPDIHGNISYETVVSRKNKFVKVFGKQEYRILLKKVLWQSKSRISFEDFSRFPELRNNFRAYFSQQGYFLYEHAYRSQGFYQRFAENHEDLLQELISIYRFRSAFYQEDHEELVLLYRAYELMFEDEEVTMNHQLFG